MKRFCFCTAIYFVGVLFTGCHGQTTENSATKHPANAGTSQPVGGNFENREFTYYGIPRLISAVDTSPGWTQQGQKIVLTGTVYQPDGKTPAPGVLLYYYHTNTEGRYLHRPEEKQSMPPNNLGQTHGYIRGWVKTNERGNYFIYTVRPGTYPTRDEPAHVHVTVKEPNELKEYYIDDFVFDDDPLLTAAKRQKMENRCGSGILRMVRKEGLQVGERDLLLGLNIPNYPNGPESKVLSGNKIGEAVFSFMPFHAWGPDKGTTTCPVCKYGWYHGILYFVGNRPDWPAIKQWLRFLEGESVRREKYLKVYFVYGNEKNFNKKERIKELASIGQALELQKVALTFVPSFSDVSSEINLNTIHQTVGNTFILYKRSRIIGKFVNLEPTPQNFMLVKRELDNTINKYFALPKPEAD